jgi:hypothetical protein
MYKFLFFISSLNYNTHSQLHVHTKISEFCCEPELANDQGIQIEETKGKESSIDNNINRNRKIQAESIEKV